MTGNSCDATGFIHRAFWGFWFCKSEQMSEIARIVQKPQSTENRAKKVANRPLLNPRMVFENGELWEFNRIRMLRLAMRRAKTQKMVLPTQCDWRKDAVFLE